MSCVMKRRIGSVISATFVLIALGWFAVNPAYAVDEVSDTPPITVQDVNADKDSTVSNTEDLLKENATAVNVAEDALISRAVEVKDPKEAHGASESETGVLTSTDSNNCGGVNIGEFEDEDDSLTVQAASASVACSAHVENIGWQGAVSDGKTVGTTGKALRLEGLKITISNLAGSVVYQSHVESIGWQKPVANGAIAGTTGRALRLEALKIWLSDDIANQYDIVYRAHVENIGWQPWVTNGAIAGTTGRALRLEAIEIKLSQKKEPSSNGTPSISYQTHVQNIGWQSEKRNGDPAGTTGQALPIEGLKIKLNTGNFSGGIEYQAHVQNIGWQNKVSGGVLAGTTGKALPVEALRIKLTGDMATIFDVCYRAHVKNIGWQPWVENGMGCGTTGQALQIEAIEIKLVNKAIKTGWEGSGTNWSYYQKGSKVTSGWVVVDESPIEEFQFDLQRYWVDANGSLAVSRFVDPSTARDSKAGYAAYATEKGYVLRGKKTMSGGSVLLADNDGRIPTTTGWITTSAYDGVTQKYYVEKSGVAALAKTGLFTVNGANYYGIPNEAYVMCGGYWYINGAWYSADSSGRLTLDTNGSITKYIERFISWAIAIANDDSHGYSQANRWGPDYDCSSLVVSSLKNSGFAVGQASWTGNMLSELTKYGFRWYSNLALRQRGDILLAHNNSMQHTEIFLGSNQVVGATSSENGGIYGTAGDQTGREIRVGTYYNAAWDGFLRYVG